MDFKNKKVAVVGAGVEGISSARYLKSKRALVSILDQRREGDFDRKKLDDIKNLSETAVFGANYLEKLDQFEIVFRSPGVRPDLPELSAAGRRGVEITSQTKLFFDLCPAPIVGITGTKGKGTTASLIYNILKSAGKKVFLGGNIGSPSLDFLDRVTPSSVVILELSSFQLIDLEKSPHVAVMLMVTSDHQDWHKSAAEYTKAKENLVKYQDSRDLVVINSDFPTSKNSGESSRGRKYYFSTKAVVDPGVYVEDDAIVSSIFGKEKMVALQEIKIPGNHNLQNICAAVAASLILKAPSDIIRKSVASFNGLPHRLEFVAEKDGTVFYDDSASTNPETAIAAIRSFKNPKILILGGSSKGADFALLARTIVEERVKAVILIGEEAGRIKGAIDKTGRFSGKIIENLAPIGRIVEEAKALSERGDIVLLSPACASFGMFENYADRGDQFKRAVEDD